MQRPAYARVILAPVPVALTQRWCPTCDKAYHGTVLTERRDEEIRSVRYSPCPECGTVSASKVEPGVSYAAAFARA